MNKLIVGDRLDLESTLNNDFPNNSYFKLESIDQKFSIEQIEQYIEYFQYIQDDDEKIGVIYDAENLSEIQQNKLLKTIESSTGNSTHYFQSLKISNFIKPILSRFLVTNYIDENKQKKLTSAEQVYYNENEKLIIQFEKYLFENKIEQIIFLISTKFNFDKINVNIYMSIIEKWIYSKKSLKYIEIYLKYAKRTTYNLDYNLQIESLLLEIIKTRIMNSDDNQWN